MSTALIVVIVVVAVVALVAVSLLLGKRRAARKEEARARLGRDAEGHRQEAGAHAARAQDLGPEIEAERRAADEHEAIAREHAAKAEEHGSKADELSDRSARAGRSAAFHDERAAEAERERRET